MPPNLTVVGHPLVQHKLSIMRDRSTSTSKFRGRGVAVAHQRQFVLNQRMSDDDQARTLFRH